jgi:predicted type IV restriction endonuclease
MDFIDRIKAIAQKIEKLKDSIQNEEATKTALIMPFINALGYDVYDPTEVAPEYTASVPGLKQDRVDYAILSQDRPIILIECKWCGENLDNPNHKAQLHKYFHVTDTKFGVLTNGVIYRFYTDIDKLHVMDEKPFFEFNLLTFSEPQIDELKKFSKSSFDADRLSNAARNLLYTKEIKRIISEQLTSPTDEFVKLFASQVHSGKLTVSVVDKFRELTQQSLKEFINEKITERLNSAINLPDNIAIIDRMENVQDSNISEEAKANSDNGSEIVTTEAEKEGFYIIKSILREVVDTRRIQAKDTKSYFGINLDGKVTKTICRLYFNANKKYVAIADATGKEAKKEITNLDSLYSVASILKDRLNFLIQAKNIEENIPSESF